MNRGIHTISETNISHLRTVREIWPMVKPEDRRAIVANIRKSQAFKHFLRTGEFVTADWIAARRARYSDDNNENGGE